MASFLRDHTVAQATVPPAASILALAAALQGTFTVNFLVTSPVARILIFGRLLSENPAFASVSTVISAPASNFFSRWQGSRRAPWR